MGAGRRRGVGYWYAGQQPARHLLPSRPPAAPWFAWRRSRSARGALRKSSPPMESLSPLWGIADDQRVVRNARPQYLGDCRSIGRAASPLIEIEASPDTQLRLEQARRRTGFRPGITASLAGEHRPETGHQTGITYVQQRFQNAQLAFNSMIDRGIGEPKVLKAAAPGLVMRIDVKQGRDLSPSGNSLLEMIGQSRIDVRFGIGIRGRREYSRGPAGPNHSCPSSGRSCCRGDNPAHHPTGQFTNSFDRRVFRPRFRLNSC